MTPSAPRIGFLYQNTNSWYHVETLFEACVDLGLHPEIIYTPTSLIEEYTTLPTGDLPGLDGRDPNVLHHIDAVVVCLPYDRARPPHLRAQAVHAQGKQLFYIPYAIDMELGEEGIERQFLQPIHSLAQAIFTHSPFIKQQFAEYCPIGNHHVYVTGLPRFDRLHQLPPIAADHPWKKIINNRTTIVLNTHHSIAYKGASSLFYFWQETMQYFLDHPEYACIWRPHPGLFSALKQVGMMKNHETIRLLDALGTLGIIVDRTPDYRTAFSLSHAFITDSGSLLVDYLTLKKPLLFQCSPYWNSASTEAQELIHQLPTVQSFADIPRFLHRVAQGRFSKACDDINFAGIYTRFLPNIAEGAGKRIAQIILQHCTHQSSCQSRGKNASTTSYRVF